MDTEAILALYDVEQRINVEFPGVRKERRPHVIRYVSETGGPHFILYSRLAGADVEAVIAEEQAYFGPLGEVEWKVYAHDRPADLRQRLVARGFEAEEPEAIMVLEAAARGYRFLTIDASPMSRPIAARHGFRLLTTAWPCKWRKNL